MNKSDKFYDSKLLGSIIRVNRLMQNMSQTSLVDGICVPSYLSRIENAEIVPSMEVVNEIFDALGISYYDDSTFLKKSLDLFDDYVRALFEDELGFADQLYVEIHADENQYMSSPIIIDFLVVKFMHLADTDKREEVNEVEKLLNSIIEHMSSDQIHNYMLYKGMDTRNIERDFLQAEAYLKRAEKEKISGKVFHEMAKLYFEWGNMILALDYINKAQVRYSEEGYVMGLIAVYMIKGQIFIYENQFEIGIGYLTKSSKLFRRIKEPTYETYINNHLAWAYILNGDLESGRLYLDKCTDKSELLRQISDDLIEPLAKGQVPTWHDDIEEIENKLSIQKASGLYHKLEEKYLELRRYAIYRQQRKYKLIDDFRISKLQF